MKRWFCILFLLALNVQAKTTVDAPIVNVMFAPQDNVQGEIARQLRLAKQLVLVQAYLLTDNKISDALIAAHKRGVRVQVLMDAERERTSSGSDARRLSDAGILVRLETQYENAHNKIILIDKKTLITGSYNFTYTAQHKNAENVLFIQNAPQLLRRYTDNWEAHYKTAVDFK